MDEILSKRNYLKDNPTKTPTCLADIASSYPGTFKNSNTAMKIERIIKRYHEFEFIFPSIS